MGPVAIRILAGASKPLLRRGDEGQDVRRLQEQLASFGYEVGEIDGRFGYLTEDALMEFQRDHRLRVDGVAGPRVWTALEMGVPRRRVVHEVRPGERWADLARRYDVSVDALRWMNGTAGRRRLEPGTRVVLRSSYVLAGLPREAGAAGERVVMTERRNISALATYACRLLPGGALEGEVDPGLSALARENGWRLHVALSHGGDQGSGDLTGALASRRRRRRFLQSLGERMDRERWEGLLLDVGPVPLGLGAGLLAGIAALRSAHPHVELSVALNAPYDGWRGLVSDFDYPKLAGLVDRVVLAFHRWDCLLTPAGEAPPRELIERWIARATRAIPPWKVLLGLPMGACRLDAPGRPVEVGYRAAVAAGLAVRRRPKAGEEGFLHLEVDRGQGSEKYVLPGRELLARWLSLAYRYRLAGLYLHPVGLEDRRLWDVIGRRVWAEKTRV